MRDEKFVVIGTTSRGTGPIGNCGGRGNPTHYVRYCNNCIISINEHYKCLLQSTRLGSMDQEICWQHLSCSLSS